MERKDLQISVPRKDMVSAIKHLGKENISMKYRGDNKIGDKHDKIEFSTPSDKEKAKKILKSRFQSQITSDPEWKEWKNESISFKEFYLKDK